MGFIENLHLSEMKSIAVFCASSEGINPIIKGSARDTGRILAEEGIQVVYGGSRLGLMGEVANGALEAGGEVIGVLPHFMRNKELEHKGLSELIYVESMHERKLKMHELTDGVLALPGGFGTFEELFEMLTWSQLGLHRKPIGVLNTEGYYDHLFQMFERMRSEELLKTSYADMVLRDEDLIRLLTQMRAYTPPEPAIRMRPSHS
jgi:hypothetical protein